MVASLAKIQSTLLLNTIISMTDQIAIQSKPNAVNYGYFKSIYDNAKSENRRCSSSTRLFSFLKGVKMLFQVRLRPIQRVGDTIFLV